MHLPKRILLLCSIVVIMLAIGRAHAEPPFWGTIFIDPDIITASDPTTFTHMTYAGRGLRTMYDRRVTNWVNLNAFLFNASFNDGLSIEVQVNPEFNDTTSASFEANKYAIVIGRLPTALRLHVQTVWIHQGVQPFGGGNNNLLIHTGQGDLYSADGILEETFVHEGSHSSLDATHAAATGWLAAQAADPEYISVYARDNPTREDIAESFLTWLAVRYRPERITSTLSNSIAAAIPNRLAYFDRQYLDMYPIVPISAVEAGVPGTLIVPSSSNSPPTQTARNAVDNNITTKYLNFDELNAGLTFAASGNRAVRALTLISAEDAPERDPASFIIEGSTNGANFTRIASNAVPPFASRHSIQSFVLPATNHFRAYRVLFPTVSNGAAANSMQVAEVELLYNGEITSTNDAVSITLPAGATDVRGVGALFDRQLDDIRKLEVAAISGGNTVVNIIPAAGPTVLKAFELIGAADDATYPQRRPSSVTVAGSNDGTNYSTLAIATPAPPSSNLQIQEFAVTNNIFWGRYRVTFGPPASGDRLQVGEMRLFGETLPRLTLRASGASVLVSWPAEPGYRVERNSTPSTAGWVLISTAPVLNNGTNTLTLPRSGTSGFFRLRK